MTCWITNRFRTTSSINTFVKWSEVKECGYDRQVGLFKSGLALCSSWCKFKDDSKLRSQREASLQPTNMSGCCLLRPSPPGGANSSREIGKFCQVAPGLVAISTEALRSQADKPQVGPGDARRRQ